MKRHLKELCILQKKQNFVKWPRNFFVGGGKRDRTDDLLLAKQALSQLSYAPDRILNSARRERNLKLHAVDSTDR